MLQLINKYKNLIIISIISCMVFSIVSKAIDLFTLTTAVISFNYPGADSGLAPDGSRLNIYDILSDEVLENAAIEIDVDGLTSDKLKGKLTVTPNVSITVSNKIKTAREQGKNYSYFPNEYKITYRGYMFLNGENPQKTLKAITDSYIAFFIKNYTETNVLPTLISKFDYNDFDYLEIAEILKRKIGVAIDYLNVKKYEYGSFKSETTDMTFGDLVSAYGNINSVDINNLYSYVYSTKVSKNKDLLIKKYEYDTANMEWEYKKLKSQTEIMHSGMKKYESELNKSVLIPTTDSNNQLFLAKTKTAYDYLTKDALQSGVNAENLLKDIENNKAITKAYKESTVTPEENERLKAVTEETLKTVEKDFEKLLDLSDKTLKDYYIYKSDGYVRSNVDKVNLFDKSLVIACLIGCIFGIILSIVLVAFFETKKRLEELF